jgi:hypothetical protein
MDKFEKLENKIDKLREDISETNNILARNTESLIIHEKRTTIAESRLREIELDMQEHKTQTNYILDQITDKLKPINQHVTILHTLTVYIIPAAAAIIVFLIKLGLISF